MMSTLQDMRLEEIYEGLVQDDAEGKKLINSSINDVARVYNLHVDDDRDEIIQFLAESIYYGVSE
tara:strand:+ start:490 stop:684 length:195 start_codon:yes stop_codon:yes gene_type:complete